MISSLSFYMSSFIVKDVHADWQGTVGDLSLSIHNGTYSQSAYT